MHNPWMREHEWIVIFNAPFFFPAVISHIYDFCLLNFLIIEHPKLLRMVSDKQMTQFVNDAPFKPGKVSVEHGSEVVFNFIINHVCCPFDTT